MKFIIIYLISLTSMHFAGDNSHWAESAIWYQIFPDRFYNGDKNNDPDKSTLNDTWPYELQLEWEVMPWTDDWYKLQDWEKTNGEDFYYNAQLRRYGGDIQGIIDKLDYLEDLGITA
ncbi:MAG: alpha-amylase family glycosyl hydrolase, partial [Candidatus Marinimicrobia bacterium]|nr:alpha-amylase family glycosyl hydrolase [Candidatus Neomarinimicrobiota bacterium]